MSSPAIPISNEVNPISSPPPAFTSSGSPLPRTPSSFEWTMELTAEMMESIVVDPNENGRIFEVNRKSLFAPLKIFACYHQFCKRAFGGTPPEECTIAEFERKMLEMLPPFLCNKDDGTRTLF